jgi:hypothetical protein
MIKAGAISCCASDSGFTKVMRRGKKLRLNKGKMMLFLESPAFAKLYGCLRLRLHQIDVNSWSSGSRKFIRFFRSLHQYISGQLLRLRLHQNDVVFWAFGSSKMVWFLEAPAPAKGYSFLRPLFSKIMLFLSSSPLVLLLLLIYLIQFGF